METSLDYKQLCKQVCLAAIEVGDYLREERLRLDTPEATTRGVESDLAVESKGVHDFVTRFDREAEHRLVSRLQELVPDAGFIAEEGTASRRGDERFTWIVDPLDGTTNFIHGLRTTCVSIALKRDDDVVLGVVYELWAQECFYAYEGGDAYLNGKPIVVSRTATLGDALLATGFPYTQFDRLTHYMRYLEWTMQHTHGVRRFGSAAADLVYTACGRCDGFFEYGLKPYDVAAGAYIVVKAGGKVCDFSGGRGWLFGGEIVASNAALHVEFQRSVLRFLSRRRLFNGFKIQRKKS